MYFYTVLEIQMDKQGNKACIPLIYDDYNGAVAKFFSICAYAAVSDIPYHSAHVLRSDGIVTDGRVFTKNVSVEPQE